MDIREVSVISVKIDTTAIAVLFFIIPPCYQLNIT